MKKVYSKPIVTKSYKGQELHTEYIKYDKNNPFPHLTDEALKKIFFGNHFDLLFLRMRAENDNLHGEIIQMFFETELSSKNKRYPGFSAALLIQNWKPELIEISLNICAPRKQIKAARVLRFLDDQEKIIADAHGKVWSGLFNELIERYIIGVTLNDFDNVMNYRGLPHGKGRIKWLSKKSEAVYFQKEMGFTMKQFNYCFIHKGRSPFREGNRTGTNQKQSYLNILAKYKR